MKKIFSAGIALLVLMCFSFIPAMAQSGKVEYPTLDPEDEQQVLSVTSKRQIRRKLTILF